MDHASQRIQDKLWYGILPNVAPARRWGRFGSGRMCDGCDLVLGLKDVERFPYFRSRLSCSGSTAWQPWQVWSSVEWCGHRVEGIPVPTEDGRWRLIPILGEAS